MVQSHRKFFIWAILLVIDVAALAIATRWVFRDQQLAVANGSISVFARTSNLRAGQVAAATANPRKIESGQDRMLQGGPLLIICGCSDLQHNAWFGTQEEGVWKYQNDQWKNFLSNDGLGDDDACAVACDCLGRIWVGHSGHGVSIYNGRQWRNYDRVAGCGGSRVYCIQTCPIDGDVWIATESGLTRYSLKNDTWKYYDRSSGMPENEVSSMAFDSRGDLYVGLQADGIAVARAADGYAKWTHFTGPDETPIRPSGAGLPSSLINTIMVTRDDGVYAGTCRGLACSADHGNTWSYVRGMNWPALAAARNQGLPDVFDSNGSTPLAEDWITAMIQDPTGVIWIGYQNKGYQTFIPNASAADSSSGSGVTALVPAGDGRCMMGTYTGAFICGPQYAGPPMPPNVKPPSALAGDAFPSMVATPTVAELDAMRQQIEALPPGADGAELFEDDCETTGDWLGRYGNNLARLMGFKTYHDDPGYAIDATTGPYRKAYMRSYWDHAEIDQVRALFEPDKKRRIICEENDESYDLGEHPKVQEGPDLYVTVAVPAGVHLVSLYFRNNDAPDTASKEQRDYVVQLKHPSANEGDDVDDDDEPNGRQFGPSKTIDAELAPTIARTRVSAFVFGVYKRFLIRGAGNYWFKIDRNHSGCTKVTGVFIDRLDEASGGHGGWFGPAYNAPSVTDYSGDAGPKGAAQRLWQTIDAASGKAGYASLAMRARLMAYRAGAANGMDGQTLTRWRRKISLWTDADREQFDQAAGIAAPSGL